jgi:hypothetical protein
MSLISVRNLFGPYRNKVQMGALIIAVILVLAIRMGTGKSNSGELPPREGRSEDLLGVLGKSRRDSQSARPSRSTDEVLDELINEKPGEGPAQDSEDRDKNESFQDIRKSLGLE